MRIFSSISAIALAIACTQVSPAVAEPELLARAEALSARGEFAAVETLLADADWDERPPAERARLLQQLANAQLELGRHDAALATAARAARDAEASGDLRSRARVESVRGAVARNRGRALDAVAHYEKVLAWGEELQAPDLVAHALTRLASAYQTLGEWSRVVDLNERAFAAHPEPSPAERFSYLIQRGIGFYEFGDDERAAASFREALRLAESRSDLRGQSLARGELGLVAWSFERDRWTALAEFDRAIELARRSGVAALEVVWLLNSGSLLRDVGDADGALERLRAGLQRAEAVGMERNAAFLRKNLGQVLASRGELDGAEPLLLASLESADRLRIPKLQWQARMELGELYRERDPERARAYFEGSLDQLEAIQAGVLLEQLQVDVLGRALEQYDPYERLIDFLMDRGEAAAAFAVAERGRARVFLNSLAAVRAAIAPEVPPDFLSAERELLAGISAAQTALREHGLDADGRQGQLATIERTEAELMLLRARLEGERPALAHVRYPRLPSLEEARHELVAGDETLLVYFLGRRRSWAWVVDAREAHVAELPARDEIAASVEAFRGELERPGARFDATLGHAVWKAVVAPLAEHLRPGTHLVVVPHGVLHFLPFEALPLPDGSFLIAAHSVSYAPSVSSLAYLRRQAPAELELRRALAIGNPVASAPGAARERDTPIGLVGHLKPLPHSGEELRRVAAAFGRVVEVREGAAATELALVTGALADVGLLHFATHALIDERRPERSGLALTAEPPDDGLLQVREIYGLRLDAALVTLSACETALGREVAGEGLIGLTRAFFHAGAGAVAATLWSVDDAAASELVGRFYRGVRRGQRLDRALAEAKRELLRAGGRRAHPYYWAPFVLVGRSDAQLRVGGGRGGLAAAIAVFVALAFAAALMALGRRRSAARRKP